MIRRFFIQSNNVKLEQVYTLTRDETRHLKKVLRLVPGDSIEVFDLNGNVFSAVILPFSDDKASFCVKKKSPVLHDITPRIQLAYAMPKGKKIDYVIQKTTELGVDELFLFISERSVVTLEPEKMHKRLERLRKISIESVKQCRRSTIPVFHDSLNLEEIIKNCSKDSNMFVCDQQGLELDLPKLREDPKKNILIIIGPEGGFSDHEKTLFDTYTIKRLSLCENVLRTETAAISAVALTAYARKWLIH